MIQPPPVDWADIQKRNKLLHDQIKKMLPAHTTSLDMEILVQQMRADQDYGHDRAPVRLLSLGMLNHPNCIAQLILAW
jgi:hypothetical protein